MIRSPNGEEVIVGDKVKHVTSNPDYDIRFPFKRGDIHLHSGIGGSQTSVLVDIADIVRSVIVDHFEIPLMDLGSYQAVWIIPALYKRPLIKHYVSMLLNDLGFGGCFVLQDHVAATFGAGLGN